jgi:hypothetical protein
MGKLRGRVRIVECWEGMKMRAESSQAYLTFLGLGGEVDWGRSLVQLCAEIVRRVSTEFPDLLIEVGFGTGDRTEVEGNVTFVDRVLIREIVEDVEEEGKWLVDRFPVNVGRNGGARGFRMRAY